MADAGKRRDMGGVSTSKVLAALTLIPVGSGLLFFSGITFVATLIGVAVVTPLFVIFSPVLVPAALTIGLGVAGFFSSGALGITGLSALSWIATGLRQFRPAQQLELAKRRAQETVGLVGLHAQEAVGQVGQKTKDVGQAVQSKAHEGAKSS